MPHHYTFICGTILTDFSAWEGMLRYLIYTTFVWWHLFPGSLLTYNFLLTTHFSNFYMTTQTFSVVVWFYAMAMIDGAPWHILDKIAPLHLSNHLLLCQQISSFSSEYFLAIHSYSLKIYIYRMSLALRPYNSTTLS